MSRKHRRAERQQAVTRRYVLRVVQRARDDIIRAVVMSVPLDDVPEPSEERIARVVGNWTTGGSG